MTIFIFFQHFLWFIHFFLWFWFPMFRFFHFATKFVFTVYKFYQWTLWKFLIILSLIFRINFHLFFELLQFVIEFFHFPKKFVFRVQKLFLRSQKTQSTFPMILPLFFEFCSKIHFWFRLVPFDSLFIFSV